MEDHILDKHALPDSDNKFSCDDCTFQTEDKKNFGKHYKENHGHQAAKIVTGVKSAATEANEKMRRDLKELKNNFERLEWMYHESLENVNQVKSEYEAKLILANDNFTVIKAENEVLKEKVDVLFKLGRSYLNNMQKPKEDSKTKVDNEKDNDSDYIEVIENDDENIESLQAWTRNKMRGFKRVDPSAPPKPTSTAGQTSKSSAPLTRAPPAASSQAPPSQETKPSEAQDRSQENENKYRVKYCHFFVNTGQCRYEERTGEKCKFEHKNAPMCNSGISCTRPKCMFSHPKVNGSNPFLGNMRSFNPVMNPWQMQMINPWMTTPNQLNSPWNNQSNQGKQTSY